MQNVTENDISESTSEAMKTVEVGQIYLTDLALSSSSDTEKIQILAPVCQSYIPDRSPSDEEEEVSEVESFSLDQDDLEEDTFLLSNEALTGADVRTVDPDTQARLEALLDAAGIGKLSTVDGNRLADPEVLRRLTSSVSCALDEAAAALTRMRTEQQSELPPVDSSQLLANACMKGDVNTVKQLLKEGQSVHETTEEGESLLSLACSAGFHELAQLLLAMKANVEDRGVKGDCTPLMEAASGGCVDIVKLLISHGADVNAQSSAGNTSLHYAACGGHEEVVRVLINAGANVEEHNENGHTPLMETATAGHITVAKILLVAGAGVNTHSNEFKESALTLACYKGHLKMAKFLLAAGADQEHKTDEMHTALMEASMDGHVDVARLLLDSGAQVNMPADSFESPLTLAACGGHIELANLLIERGANLEEVNDEGYTPLMEAAREGHEEMVALLLAHGADINAQTEETQETALTLACCGGFLEVADFLIKADADLELGCSTPLMEASQEGHLELVKYLIETGADVHAETQTGDTSLTYACENGHTDVAKVLLERGAKLEHQSEGGRTPLMKAARAGHLCTVQFLINEGADVNQHTSTNDHSVLSLACAGGHLAVVELLLRHSSDPTHKLKDGSTMLIEAAKGGHVNVVNLLLDWPNSVLASTTDATHLSPHSQLEAIEMPRVPMQGLSNVVPPQDPNHVPFPNIGNTLANIDFAVTSTLPLPQVAGGSMALGPGMTLGPGVVGQVGVGQMGVGGSMTLGPVPGQLGVGQVNLKDLSQERMRHNMQESLCRTLRINKKGVGGDPALNSTNNCSAGVVSVPAFPEHDVAAAMLPPPPEDVVAPPGDGDDMKASERLEKFINNMMKKAELLNTTREEQIVKKQQILEELQKVETELHEKARAQLMLNVEQKQRSQQQQLLQQQVQLATAAMQAGAEVSPPSLHSLLKNQLELTKQAVLNMGKTGQGEAVGVHVIATTALTKQESLGSADSADSGCGISDNCLGRDVAGQPDGQPDGVDTEAVARALVKVDGDGRASDDVDLSNVMPFRDKKQADGEDAEVCNGAGQGQVIAADGEPPQAVQLQQQRHLQQQKQQLQAQLVLQQQLQHELQQQLQLQQEHQQLQQQLKAHQVQMQLQQQDLQVKDGDNMTAVTQLDVGDDADLTVAQQQLQQQQQQQDLVQQLKLQQVQQHLQQLHHQLQHVQQLQNSQQMTQQELLQQAYQLQLQLQQAQQLQLMVQQQQQPGVAGQQQNQVLQQQQQGALLLTQQELLQQAQQVQQEFELSAQQQQCLLPANKMLLPVQLPIVDGQPMQLPPLQQLPLQLMGQPGTPPPVLANNQVVTAVNYTTTTTIAAAAIASSNSLYDYYLDMMTPSSSVPLTPNPSPASPLMAPPVYPSIDLDAQTESNHDTALTLACAGGHTELVGLLLTHGADIEHRDKKGFTPLILAATAGHADVVEVLLENGADIEAQSERTKDTPLSLACSGGRYEVVELLLVRGANKEHRNVSDYTPLSLAASGGYVNIIKLLLNHGAEINSRTGSKLGISPLMLAAMNGHTNAVKLLLDMGSDINAQIETNRNTALTLACFQGRHEVVSLLVDRRANIEHRAKTGLTPLMEAASGGYVEVGHVLLEKGADVNAPPVPSSRDTALTIAADKGHNRFVDLLLSRGAAIDVKNKKGNSPLWLACNGGHAEVVHLLVNARADVDSQDNRKVSCLMAAFRKGHVKVVKWLVKHVTQFPSDQECVRYIATVTDKELLKKCNQCMDIIVGAKDRQAAEANKNASILLEEIDQERSREESKRAAAARKREKRRKKKKEKQEKEQRQKDGTVPQNHLNGTEEDDDEGEDTDKEEETQEPVEKVIHLSTKTLKEETMHLFIEPPNGSTDTTLGYKLPVESNKRKINSRLENEIPPEEVKNNRMSEVAATRAKNKKNRSRAGKASTRVTPSGNQQIINSINNSINAHGGSTSRGGQGVKSGGTNKRGGGKADILATTAGIGDLDDFGVVPQKGTPGKERSEKKGNSGKTARGNTLDCYSMLSPANKGSKSPGAPSPKKGMKKEEDWKEVIRKSKKIIVSANLISRVIGRGGSSINAIREVSGAHIEVDKQKSSTDRVVSIRGSAEATRQAHNLITALIRDSDRDVEQMIPRLKAKAAASTNNPLALATNVWHNSMANSVPSTSSTTSSCSPLVSHRGGAAVVTTVSTVVQTTQVLATRSQMSSTEISTTHVATGAWGNATFPPLGRVSGSKVMSNGPVATGQGQVVGKSGVSRQLFPREKSAAAQQHAMYTSPATVNTKVVSMSAMNPAAEVEAKVTSSAGKSLSKVPGSGRHPPGVQVTKIASEPQLLPILTCGQTPPPTGNMTCRSHAAVSPVPTAVALPPGEYSPFNNLFGKVAENVIGQKNDLGGSMEHRVNFANVAGSGAMAPTSNAIQMGMVAPPGGHSQPDESLQAKAPGYKAPGQRVPGMEGVSGYKGGMLQHSSQQPSFPYGVPGSFSMLYSQGPLGGAVPPMMPDMSGGMPGMGFGMPPLMGMMSSMDPGRHSPRLDAFGFPHSTVRTEYSTQDRPMTLPKIDSNLNPNAPNFTSMFLQRQRRQQAAAAASRMAMAPGGGMMPGRADAMPGGGAADAIPGGPDMMPPMPHPAFRVPMQVGVPKAYNGNVITSPPPPQQPPIGNNAFHQAPPDSNVSDFTPSLGAPRFNPLIGSAPFIGVASTPQPPPKQFSPLASSASVARSSSTPSSVGASSKDDGSPVPPGSNEVSPVPSSNPSPTDHMRVPGDDRRLPRPIGTERSMKKPPMQPGGFQGGMGDAPSAGGIWTFQNELSSNWMASVTSVVTSSIMTSSIGSAGLGGMEGELQRPHSQPAMVSSAFSSEPIIMDKNYPGQTLLMPSNVPGVYGNAIDMSAIYAQAAASAESLPAMWNPATGDTTAPQSKMVWTDWARQPDM